MTNTQPQAALLPCPFCGSHALHEQDDYIACSSCNAYGPSTEIDETIEEAWNRRAKLQADTPASEGQLLLKRAHAHIMAWAKTYGDNNPQWLPPAGSVELLEDISAALTQPTAASTDVFSDSKMATSRDGDSWRIVLEFADQTKAKVAHTWLMDQGVPHGNVGTAPSAKPTAARGEVVGLERIYETIIRWDEGGGKRSRRELARRIVALYTNPPARQPQAGTVSRAMLEASRVAKGQSAFFEQMMERSMSKKLTHWFDGRTQKPWESGVYQQRSASGLLGYQYWDGQYWYGWGESVEGAMSMYKPSNKVHPSFMNDDWRGLAHPPKNIGNAMQARQQAGGA